MTSASYLLFNFFLMEKGILLLQIGMEVIFELEKSVQICPVNSGYGYEKLKKKGYGAGTLKMGMERVWVWV